MSQFICCFFPIKKQKKQINSTEYYNRKEGETIESVKKEKLIIDPCVKNKPTEEITEEPYIKEGQGMPISNRYPSVFAYHRARLEMEKYTGITDTCPVCLEEFTIKLPIRNCHHKYHNKCVVNKICPICSRLIDSPEGVNNDDEFYVKFNLLRERFNRNIPHMYDN